ncbi:MAG: chromate efflux transporter [Candidatus Aminicenantales bacterium]
MEDNRLSGRLKEVALLFLKLGAFSFGGPAVYIALMHHETVRRRHWIDEQRFLDLVGATNLIPGPNAAEMAIHLGRIRAGWSGLIASGVLFILPGMAATLFIAWAYVTYGSIPAVGWVLYGVKPVVIGIVIEALWKLGRKGIKGPTTAIVGTAIAALYILGVNEIALLFGGAAVVLLVHGGRHCLKHGLAVFAPIPVLIQMPLTTSLASIVPFSQTTLFLSFLKIGSVLFGSGYVLLAFLKSEFVVRLGWLTNQQVLDAIVAGQITPGPVFSSATFVGYLLGGWPAALLATLGIFLPSFLFVGLLSRILPYVRKSPWAATFLDGVNAASLGLMAGVTVQLGQTAIMDIFTVLLLLVTLFVMFRHKVNPIWFIIGGGLMGVLKRLVIG